MNQRDLAPALTTLKRFAARPSLSARCELCGGALPDDHTHVVAAGGFQLSCSCGVCASSFVSKGDGPYRVVDPHFEVLPVTPSAEDWRGLGVPVRLLCVVVSESDQSVVGLYPSPAGPIRSLVSREAWLLLCDRYPALAGTLPDVQCVLLCGLEEMTVVARMSLDHCFELTARLGASRSPERVVREFVECLTVRCRT